jgi:glutamyl/glutaminyl-tRNA synthetase
MLTRLAPTPSGFLHEGNLYNFLLNWLWARAQKGKVLLRIDDADAERKRPEYVEDIFRMLEKLGLDWDTGPSGPDDFENNWSQHHRKEHYDAILKELSVKEKLFACVCTRKDLANGRPCDCPPKKIPLTRLGIAWRLLPDTTIILQIDDKALGKVSASSSELGSFVVRKKDRFAAYQLCSLADDRHFGVTHICRGEDLLPSSFMQCYLDQLLDERHLEQCRFWHHGLVLSDKGDKLSKSAGAKGESMLPHLNKERFILGFSRWLGYDTHLLKDLLQVPLFVA